MVAMVASVMAIPLAYIAGKGNADTTLSAAVEEELIRSRAEREAELASIRQDIAEASLEQARAENNTQRALWKAGINFDEDTPSDDASTQGEAQSAITFEAFEALELDTSYQAIVKAFGREGSMKLSMEDNTGSITQQFVWKWIAADGTPGKVDLSFVNGKLSDKSYRG